MLWENLIVDRIIIHEVHKRQIDRKAIIPTYSTGLLTLNPDGLAMFADRVVSAIGSRSQSMEMAIKPPSPGCLIEVVHDLLGVSDAAFVSETRRFADKLTEAQGAINLPGGLLVVFDGMVGTPGQRFIGVIKAETHSGFRITANLQAQFLSDLFLTPQAKLYKLAIFVYDGTGSRLTLPDGWRVAVYDTQMTASNRDGAAQYFYEDFLGCELPSTSSRLTRVFYEQTRKFIDKLGASTEKKADYISGLYTYLKVDQSPNIDIGTFSNMYFPNDIKDGYEKHMNSKGFPSSVVEKSLTELSGKLRRRRLSFNRNIQLTGPSEAFEEIVRIREISLEVENGHGRTEILPATEIIIQGQMQERE